MPIQVRIADGSGRNRHAKVSRSGELAVSPLNYDETVFKELGTINVGVNFYEAKPQQQFVITGMRECE